MLIDPRTPTFCQFNLSALNDKETILDAELHLFQSRRILHNLKQPPMQLLPPHRLLPASQSGTYIIKIYQVKQGYRTKYFIQYLFQNLSSKFVIIHLFKYLKLLSSSNTSAPIKKLIAARRLHAYHSGWHIFPILTTVESWISGRAENFGIYTEILSESGKIIENKLERNNLQPILILFTNNNKSSLLEQKDETQTYGKLVK